MEKKSLQGEGEEDRFCGGWQVSGTAQCVGEQRGGQAEKG